MNTIQQIQRFIQQREEMECLIQSMTISCEGRESVSHED